MRRSFSFRLNSVAVNFLFVSFNWMFLVNRIGISHFRFGEHAIRNERIEHNKDNSRLVFVLIYRYVRFWKTKVFHSSFLSHRTYEEAVAFTKVLRNIYDRHSGVLSCVLFHSIDDGDDGALCFFCSWIHAREGIDGEWAQAHQARSWFLLHKSYRHSYFIGYSNLDQ